MKKLIHSAASKLEQETPLFPRFARDCSRDTERSERAVSALKKRRILSLCASNGLIFLLVLGVVLAGCATTKEDLLKKHIYQSARKVNIYDGIGRDEAVIMAQKCLIDSEYKDDYYASKYTLNYNSGDRVWRISFVSKNIDDPCMYGALINGNTGQILCQCLKGL